MNRPRQLSLLYLLLTLPAGWTQGALVGQWDFDDPAALGKATVGQPLVLVGSAAAAAGYGTGDGAAAIGIGSHWRCTPNIVSNGGSSIRVNEYTLVFDVWLPASSDGVWRTLFQTDPANSSDGEYFISPSNTLGVGVLTYSTGTLPAERWYRIVFSADLGSNIDGGNPSASFLSVVTDAEGNGWTFRHSFQALNGRHSLGSKTSGNLLLLFADENAEDALLHVSRVQLFNTPLSESEARALGPPVVTDPNNRPPTVFSGTAGPSTATTGQSVAFSFSAVDDDADTVAVTVDWGDRSSSTSAAKSAGDPLPLNHTWATAGTYPLTVKARDEHGAWSDPVVVQSITVTGATTATFRTPPYLQNVRTDGIVIMTETTQNVPLAVAYGESLSLGTSVPMTRVASGGGSWFHRAPITDLLPESEYYYRLTALDGTPLTDLAHFHTAPDREIDFKFSSWGDSQGQNRGVWTANPLEPTVSMMKHMVTSGVAFGLAVGDMAEDGNSYADTRSYYLDRVARHLGTSVPFFTAWGNHDTPNPSSPLRLASDMPSRYRPGFSPGHGSFSFTYSNCFFVCLDEFYRTEITNGWLEQQLASPAAQQARFRFLGVHVPPYCERWIDGNATLRNTLVPLLEKYKVTVCFSGHTHEYERGFLNHVHYVITGGGSWLDHTEVVVRDWEHMTVGGAHNVPGQWASQSRSGVLGAPKAIVGGLFNEYTLITIRDRFLRLEAQAFNADGSPIGVLDSFEIGTDPGPDTDGDGLRDAWESAHGLDTARTDGLHGAEGDWDGDGQSNQAEQLAGTRPNDPASALTLLQTLTTESGSLDLTWSSVPGKRYGISLSQDLISWSRAADAGQPLVVPAAEAVGTTRHVLPPLGPGNWYARVHVES
ncbi:MAG: metallophosphoesterase [Verrucomicrobiales bacterium]